MPNASILELQVRLQAAMNGTSLELAPAVLEAVGLRDFPAWLLPQGTLQVENAILSIESDEALHVTGSFAHPSLGGVTLEVVVAASAASLTASLTTRLASTIGLEQFLSNAGLDVASALKLFLQGEELQAIAALRRGADLVIELALAGSQQLHLGPIPLRLALTMASIGLNPLRFLSIAGTLRIGGLEQTVVIPAEGDIELQVDTTGITVESLLAAVGIELPHLPPLPLITQPLSGLLIELVDGTLCMGGTRRISGVGYLTLSIANVNGTLGFVMALQPFASFKFSTLHPALAPLDLLLTSISFGDPAILLSSLTAEAFPVVDAAGRWTKLSVERGAEFRGDLMLSGFGLDAIKMLVGADKLPFRLPVNSDLSDLQIQVYIEREIALLPSVLTIDHFNLSLVAEPLTVAVKGIAHLQIFGERLPDLVLGAGVAPGVYQFTLMAEKPWEHPLGLPFTVEEVGFQIDGPVVAYGIFGAITLKQTKARLATKFIGSVPTFLDARLEGELSMMGLLKELAGIDLVLPFEPVLKDAILYVVVNPIGETIAGRHYSQGLGLAGTMTFLSLEAAMAVSADKSAVFGRASFTKPIVLNPIFRMEGEKTGEGPFISIDTRNDPILLVRAKVNLLGLEQDVHGEVGKDFVEFLLDSEIAGVKAALKSRLTGDSLSSEGDVSFEVKGSIGPIRIVDGGPSLGTLNLDTQFNAHLLTKADTSGSFRLALSGSVSVLGTKVGLPEIELNIRSLAELPGAILEYLRANASTIFAALFSTAEDWLRAIAEGAISLVDSAAKVLIDHFKKDVQYAANVLVNVLKMDIAYTSKQLLDAGQTVVDIAKGLADINRVPNEIRAALESLGIPAAAVSDALQRAFPGIPHADAFLIPHSDQAVIPHADVAASHQDVAAVHSDVGVHADFSTPHLDFNAFGGHTDEGGHTDGGHIDVILAPHLDATLTPHLDTGPTAHVDTGPSGHVDTP